jgi:hypothetical protein
MSAFLEETRRREPDVDPDCKVAVRVGLAE